MEKLAGLFHLLVDNLEGLLGVKALKQTISDLLQLPERRERVLLVKARQAAGEKELLAWSVPTTAKDMVERLLDLLRDAIGFVVLKFDEVLPPETRADFLRAVSKRGLLAMLAALVFIYIIFRILWGCGCCFFNLLASFSYEASMLLFASIFKCCRLIYGVCCLCARGLGIRMMKAPGAVGPLIPRFFFECCPRLYFVGERTAKGLIDFFSGKPCVVTCLGGFVAWAGVKLLSGIGK